MRRSPADHEQRLTIFVEHPATEKKRIPDGGDTTRRRHALSIRMAWRDVLKDGAIHIAPRYPAASAARAEP